MLELKGGEVVPTKTVTTNGHVASDIVPAAVQDAEDEALRTLARRHLENIRKFKLYLSVYVLSMLVLTPVWIVTQYESSPGWLQHLSSRSRYPGDWDPWLIWVALIGAVLVALAGLRAYFSQPETESEIDREVERLKSKR
jgi:hypothetical protein